MFADIAPELVVIIYLPKRLRFGIRSSGNTAGKPAGPPAQIKPAVERWSSSTQWVRHREVFLANLRIGHTRVTYGHLMACSDSPLCPSCHVPPSVVHILVDYPKYASLHRPLFLSLRSLPCSEHLSLVLAESPTLNCDALFTFVSRSALYVTYN